jgi:hypothetical protein
MRPSRLEKEGKPERASMARGHVESVMPDTEVYDFGNAIGIVGFFNFD